MHSNDLSQLDFRRPPRRKAPQWRRWIPAVLALAIGIGVGAAIVGSQQPAQAVRPERIAPLTETLISTRTVPSPVPTTVTKTKTARAAAPTTAARTTTTKTVTAVRSTVSVSTATATTTLAQTVVETIPVTVTAAPEPAPETAVPETTTPAVQALAAVNPEADSDPATASAEVYFKNCSAARAAGAAPLLVGQPGYRAALDRDNDGVACE